MNRIDNKKNVKSTVIALVCILAFWGILLLIENLNLILPNVPKLFTPTSKLFMVLRKVIVYSLIAVSMNLLNGFTGLFSLGHAGFMLLGAYTFAILTTPVSLKVPVDGIFYKYGGSIVNFSLQEAFGSIFGNSGAGGAVSLVLGVLVALIISGLVAALFAYLIGLPVLRLKSDYLAIATLGFAEIIRTIFQCEVIKLPGGGELVLGKLTNGANMIKGFPTLNSFNITNATGQTTLYLSTVVPAIIVTACIVVIVLLINSTYGRSFKAIRDDEIAAEAMGINLAKHKILSFCISAFFAAVGGALYAMFATTYQAKPFTSVLTYEILLIVVTGGIGSVTGSCIGAFLYIACSEWWLRFLDEPMMIGAFQVPLLKDGFRMVVFSIVIMIVVLFFRKGIMGTKELPDLFKKRKVKAKTEGTVTDNAK
ncbi:MAG: branched-chain amino acid ABC transporter permease [Clostridia bacterium]|nr:branched-chain amino acid ABC transporter permease [Clostridia bacterium]